MNSIEILRDKTGNYFICDKDEVILEPAKTISPNTYGLLGCVEMYLPDGKLKIRTWGVLNCEKVVYAYDRSILCEF